MKTTEKMSLQTIFHIIISRQFKFESGAMQLIPSMLYSGLQSSFWCHDSYCNYQKLNNIIFRVKILFILRKPHAMRQWWSTMVKKKNTDKIMLNEDALLPHSRVFRICWVDIWINHEKWITLNINNFATFNPSKGRKIPMRS